MAVPPTIQWRGELASALGNAPAQEVAASRRYLESCLTPALDRSVRITRKVVVSRDIPGAILAAAESIEADLIAIATHGRGAITRARVGSVADKVVREASVSTMVVHPMLRIPDFKAVAYGMLATSA